MTIGIPGCGKSTYMKKNYPDAVYLSSDELRQELLGDVTCQDNNDIVFYTMRKRAVDALNEGKDVIYDATNITRKSRAQILKECPLVVQKIAMVIWAPIGVCKSRDEERKRTVGHQVIDVMLKRFQPPFWDEGFNDIQVIMNDDDFVVCPNEDYIEWVKTITQIPQDNPHHKLTLDKHLKQAAEYIYSKYNIDCESAALPELIDECKYTALLNHDIGKPLTKTFTNAKGETTEEAHYYGHQGYGAWMSYGLLYEDERVIVPWLIAVHMDPYLNTKYWRNLPKQLKDLVDEIHEADVCAH